MIIIIIYYELILTFLTLLLKQLQELVPLLAAETARQGCCTDLNEQLGDIKYVTHFPFTSTNYITLHHITSHSF